MSLNIRDSEEIQKKIMEIFTKSVPAFNELSSISMKDIILDIDTSQKEFGTISLRSRIDNPDMQKKISKNAEKMIVGKKLDTDTIWMTCSMYYDYKDGEIMKDQAMCEARNGYSFPVSYFMPNNVYRDLEKGILFVVENALRNVSNKRDMQEIEKEINQITIKRNSFAYKIRDKVGL